MMLVLPPTAVIRVSRAASHVPSPLHAPRVDLLHAQIAFPVAFSYLAAAAWMSPPRCRARLRDIAVGRGANMRLLPGIYGALLSLAIGGGEAMAACCFTAPPVHVYVPPPHVYVPPPHVVVIPHTTSVRPVTITRVNPSTKIVPSKPTPHRHIVPTVIVDTQAAPASKSCKGQQTGQGCKKKDDDQSGWATVRRWLQIGKQ
jgi:hypothetical protein